MNIEELREVCLHVKGATECMPFNDTMLVFKVMEKMFACIGLEPKDGQFAVNLKCNPEKSAELREQYRGITHGSHTHGLLWNAVYLASDVPDVLIKNLIAHSVEEVIKKLPKKKTRRIQRVETIKKQN
ncbi:MAG: MmcQ/YjbR family DNA-binding protein [Bacteroidales bacterium]|jgi:predicted DNA-binding protein (MmcQ/YjbR family)|nr:MmcQ/YjbR family DNA-binding protein [Bacteroidales bacterium]